MTKTETYKKIAETFMKEYDKAVDGDKKLLITQLAQFLSKERIAQDQKQLDAFFKTLELLIEKQSGITRALVTTKIPLDTKNKKLLEEKLQNVLNTEQVILEEKINERIIGGIKIEVAGRVYVDTIQRKLATLRQTLKAS